MHRVVSLSPTASFACATGNARCFTRRLLALTLGISACGGSSGGADEVVKHIQRGGQCVQYEGPIIEDARALPNSEDGPCPEGDAPICARCDEADPLGLSAVGVTKVTTIYYEESLSNDDATCAELFDGPGVANQCVLSRGTFKALGDGVATATVTYPELKAGPLRKDYGRFLGSSLNLTIEGDKVVPATCINYYDGPDTMNVYFAGSREPCPATHACIACLVYGEEYYDAQEIIFYIAGAAECATAQADPPREIRASCPYGELVSL